MFVVFDDPASKREVDSLMAEARHADPCLCRSSPINKALATVLPDTARDCTCITDKIVLPSDKMCSGARTTDLVPHQEQLPSAVSTPGRVPHLINQSYN